MKLAAAFLLVVGGAGGIAATRLTGEKPVTHPKAPKKTIRPAHGLMLFPRTDPDAHAQNGAESIDTAP